MKVGTDAMLLGAWAEVESASHILDIGTGTGVLALMAAQRNLAAIIHGLEVDMDAFEQANENIERSPWPERIQLFHTPIQSFQSPLKYDSLLCNPPFFDELTKPPNSSRQLARHQDSLPYEELIQHSLRLLSPAGKIHLILPSNKAEAFIYLAEEEGLFPIRITQVSSLTEKTPHRWLLSLGQHKLDCKTSQLIIQHKGRNNYTDAYKDMTQAFHTIF